MSKRTQFSPERVLGRLFRSLILHCGLCRVLMARPRTSASNTSPGTGSLGDRSGKPHHVGAISQILDEWGRGTAGGRPCRVRAVLCPVTRFFTSTIIAVVKITLRTLLFTPLYPSGNRRSLVQVVVQQFPQPAFNPSSHQQLFTLSPRIPHALPTAVSTVGPAPINVRLTISR